MYSRPFTLPVILLASALLLPLHVRPAAAADKELLDVLLSNGSITQQQYDKLIERDVVTSEEVLEETSATDVEPVAAEAVAKQDKEDDLALKTSYGSNGFRLETNDGNWQTNLQWRGQLRVTSPLDSDPRQLSAFAAENETNLEARRVRMKIGGHGYAPWLKYYFEVDLQPARDVDDSSDSASARVLDWRIDIAKWGWGSIRVGQWKIDLNRERVDSSGRQQFVERSIVNRVFTIDRQLGIQIRGRAFENTRADLRYWAGVFNGEGRGVRNNDDGLMYMGRVQWNFLGRDLPWRQTDVEYTELPTGSFAIGGATNTGSCTRWSSSGCGSLDGFESPATAATDQFKIDQFVQEFAFKYRGLSLQQEYHEKNVEDRAAGADYELTGGYFQAGYFFHGLFPSVPAPLEFAARYAYLDEPNAVDRTLENEREEFTLGANWFFSGHNNKLTFDVSRLTLDDGLLGVDDSATRVRLQWDVSF